MRFQSMATSIRPSTLVALLATMSGICACAAAAQQGDPAIVAGRSRMIGSTSALARGVCWAIFDRSRPNPYTHHLRWMPLSRERL